jgi:ABC-type dipeptide/oligopeptide/nickel transport system permease subunit
MDLPAPRVAGDPGPGRPGALSPCVGTGLAIMLTVLGFNLLGDAIRDALDPRLRL